MLYRLFITLMVILFPISAYAEDTLDNCLPYQKEITSLLESEDVPADYFYLAVCESGCKNVVSSKGARGFFQITPSIYRHYKSDDCSAEDIDDVRCNTIAAARYIKHLRGRFKHIVLLVRAYNRGGTNFQRSNGTGEADALSKCVLQYISNDNV